MLEEDLQGVDERARSCLTRGTTPISIRAPDILLDGVDQRNARNGFGGDGRIAALGDLKNSDAVSGSSRKRL